MTSKIPWETRHFGWLAAFAAALALLYLLSPILAPFLFAAILAYICNPAVTWLARRRVARPVGASLLLLLLIGLLALLALILLPLFLHELSLLSERLPGIVARLGERLRPWLLTGLGLDLQLDLDALKQLLQENMQGRDGLGMKLLASIRIGGLALVGFLINLLLVPVVLFYLLRDWNLLLERVDLLLPRRWRPKLAAIAGEIDAVLAEFLRGQVAVMLLMSAFYVLGLWIAGLQFALPIGVISGMLVFIPYVGFFTGFVLATLVALMQFSTLAGALPVWVVFALGQGLEGMLLTPVLVGKRIGLHPVAVLFALLAFGQLFGFFGVLLALPASAALLVALRHLGQQYLESETDKS